MSDKFPVKGKVYPLSHTYNMWFHKTNDRNWSSSSYTLLHSFSDLKGFWDFFQKHPNPQTGMYFLMKDPVIPTWEDKHNQPGGCWSFKLDRNQAQETWMKIAMTLVGNILTIKPESMKYINGISLTLRKHNSVIKVWQNDSKESEVKHHMINNIPNLVLDQCIFQKHEGRD